jgi:hypothetical protein
LEGEEIPQSEKALIQLGYMEIDFERTIAWCIMLARDDMR